ncbi:MAG: hypothetical protein GX363_02220 [Clostridiales bacterium]|jgi:flagellar assembly protein FliH|nr:hypothetical protein [Clostridiales bacterium]
MISLSSIVKADLLYEIPAEELLDEESMSGDYDERIEHILRQAIRRSKHIEKEAKKRADALLEDAYEKSRRIAADAESMGYKKGYEQGLQDGYKAAREEATEGLNEIEYLIELIKRQQREAYYKEEANLIDLAFEIAKKILRREAEVDKDLIPKMILDIISENEGALKVYLSEYNEALDLHIDRNILDKIKKETKNLKLVTVSHPDMMMVDTEKGVIDLSISEQLKKIRNACDEE